MTAVCDNQGVITKCVTPSNTSLRRQHDTNHDLYLTQHHYRKKTNLKLEWVKGHTDKSPWQLTEDLLFQKTGKEAIFNIWCDRVTQQTWHTGVTGMPDPEATHIERWSVFSKYPYLHKIIGHFNSEIHATLSFEKNINLPIQSPWTLRLQACSY